MSTYGKFVLCVDDDTDDLFLLQEAIRETSPGMEIVQFGNGADALEYLKEAKADHELPCVVVLDINMPIMDGKETLRRIKAESGLSHVQVVVLTTSSAQGDKDYFSAQNIRMFTKPVNMKDLKAIAGIFMEHCK